MGRLSREGVAKWPRRLGRIEALGVIALLRRDRDDPNEQLVGGIKADSWELPILETVISPPGVTTAAGDATSSGQ